MLATALVGALALTSPASSLNRRDALFSAAISAASFAAPALADGANSATTALRARAIYGSRVYRLQSASAADILDEKNMLRLFVTGTYRGEGGSIKADKKKLLGLEKEIVAAAEKGDTNAAQAKLKEFIAFAKITELDSVQGGSFNPKQRRNAGAPETAAIEAQMGTSSYALYAPVKEQAKGIKLTN